MTNFERTGIDFGRAADDYGRHRAGFPEALYERLAHFGIGLEGQRVLDLGTGTGALARGFAQRGCRTTGLDLSLPLMGQGQRIGQAEGVWVGYVRAVAEATPFAPGAFDGVSAGQCWHWFDRSRAAQEVRRLLKPGGWLAIAHFDWLPLPGNVVEATEQLILQHNPAWRGAGGNGIHDRWLYDVAVAGFTAIETFSFDSPALYSPASWRGRIRASAGITAGGLTPAQVAAFDAELRDLLADRFRQDPLPVPHRTFAVVCRK